VAVVTTVWSSEGDVTGPIGHMARQAENPVAKTSKRAAGNHMTCTLPGGTSGGQATAAAAPCESDTLGRAPNGEGTARKKDLSSAAFGWNPWCGGLPASSPWPKSIPGFGHSKRCAFHGSCAPGTSSVSVRRSRLDADSLLGRSR
jgi:hypothetical protein